MGQRKHKYFSRYISEHVKRRFFSNRNAGSILVCGASQPATNSDKHFFAFFCVWVIWGGAEGGGSNVLSTSVGAHYVTLGTSHVRRCVHMMLRWTRLMYCGERTSCSTKYIFLSSVHAHDVKLHTMYVLRRMHMMLRWTRLMCLGADT